MKTVLSVDDNKTFLETFRRLFTFKGYNSITISNPTDALETIKKTGGSIDLLVTDLNMPELSGDRLIEEAHRVAPNMRYILYTARPEDTVRPILERLKAGGVDVIYLQKPSSLDEILSAVESLIGTGT
ncbi:MAG: response regulator [Nanoarchaeota archaeon]|nr:response regulator [Nanoarchaeota archaeon]